MSALGEAVFQLVRLSINFKAVCPANGDRKADVILSFVIVVSADSVLAEAGQRSLQG